MLSQRGWGWGGAGSSGGVTNLWHPPPRSTPCPHTLLHSTHPGGTHLMRSHVSCLHPPSSMGGLVGRAPGQAVCQHQHRHAHTCCSWGPTTVCHLGAHTQSTTQAASYLPPEPHLNPCVLPRGAGARAMCQDTPAGGHPHFDVGVDGVGAPAVSHGWGHQHWHALPLSETA